ncbi:unnamed protein product [Adineta steineri]|uniref:Uncharacterized protein n=1 Tax=Adineta steineri TaxID=433720 RepID=A0A819WNG6_9BILA|nr:unnamed protein product [Adineta steineri]
MEQINVFRPYIKDLCKQLEHIHKQNQSDTPLTVFRVIFGISIKLKDKTSSLDNCVGLDCTTFSTTTERHSTLKTETSALKRPEPSIPTTSSKPMIPSISTTTNPNNLINSTPTRTNESETTSSEYCFPVRWESIGDEIISQGSYRSFTVDDVFNVYVINAGLHSLEKWSSSNKLIQRYFNGNFGDTALFYHSLSQSLYFCYTWEENSGIYRLDSSHSKPINVLNNTMSGIGQYRIESKCDGLYVNSGGDIFVLFRSRSHVIEWTVNNPTGILVADGYGSDSTTGGTGSLNALTVNEIDNTIYLMDQIGPRILKFTNSSTIGTVIFDATIKKEIFSDVQPTFNYGWALIADKTGNILLAINEKISILTSDDKFNATILKDYRAREDKTIPNSAPEAMAFDRLGNLYVFDAGRGVLKFNRTSTTCTNTNS